jgi:hypothetical protein
MRISPESFSGKRHIQCLFLFLAMLTSSVAMAQQFNNGIPEGWTCEGNCGVLGANGVVTLAPGGGTRYGWISTDQGINGVALEGVGGEGEATNGTRLRTFDFLARAGDDLEFRFNYVTTDGAEYVDYAWARLLDAELNEVALLFTARTTPGGNSVPGFAMPEIEATITPSPVEIIDGAPTWAPLGPDSGLCYDDGCGYTGWIRSNFEMPADGSYVIEFGVVNWMDTEYQSGLAIDTLTLNRAPLDSIFHDRFED